MVKVIKRNGTEVPFESNKIYKAIEKAINHTEQMGIDTDIPKDVINTICNRLYSRYNKRNRAISVDEISNDVETELMKEQLYEVAKAYIKYKYNRSLIRKANTTDDNILSLINLSNEEIKQENSNKNPIIISTQRDYMAGEVSKDLSKRFLLPQDIIEAHEQGIIHFHDMDYYAQTAHNCCLINLEDMLQNGTVISGTLIEKPHSFSTACNVATQIVAQVASSQYGGQTLNLAHLAPFVEISRQKIRKQVEEEIRLCNGDINKVEDITEKRLKIEITKGIQTIQYQVVTLMTTNGQAPFLSIFMYLNDAKSESEKKDLAMIIEEMLKQRTQGVKNEKGVWVTPAFPKLLYVLEDDNCKEGTEYWWLTQIAVKCSIKRLVPDYISEKIMLESKGDVYGCMGCVDKDEIVSYKFYDFLFVESFKRFWDRMSSLFEIKTQNDGINKYIDLNNVKIYDKKHGFIECKRIIRNHTNKWYDITGTNGRTLRCTEDHPLATSKGRILAKDLKVNDEIYINKSQYSENYKEMDKDLAWAYGVLLCDSSISSNIVGSFALNDEDDIIGKLSNVIHKNFGCNFKVQEQHRGKKGNYKDLRFYNTDKLKYQLISMFEGIAKVNRHIPNEVFSWNEEAKYSFLAGMIDADGYINNNSSVSKIQIGSTNKELALQQMALAQSLGMAASLYKNHYSSKNPNKIRYRVEFTPNDTLLQYIVCKKKFNKELNFKHTRNQLDKEISTIKNIQIIDCNDFSYDVTTESDYFDVSGIVSHNCRSFLTPDRFTDNNVGNIANAKNYKEGTHKYWGRFNQGVVTINLVDVACSSKGDFDKFWKIFDDRLELCHKALRLRHEHLLGTKSDVAPILWQHGALARLEKGETIDKLLYDGYSTISLGYAGLFEMCKYMTGESHTSPKGKPFAIKVMQYMNDKCTKWKSEENIDYSIYGSPIESTTYKFAKCLQKRFGKIPEVTDYNYVTNSYHVNVREEIDAFTKLKFESEFQLLSPGGAISYIEIPNMQHNVKAVEAVVKYIYENIMYAELNTKSDYCQVCGWDGEIKIVEDESGKLIWECPQCKNRDESKMNVTRRTCGYLGSNFWNQGRTQEIKERVLHL